MLLLGEILWGLIKDFAILRRFVFFPLGALGTCPCWTTFKFISLYLPTEVVQIQILNPHGSRLVTRSQSRHFPRQESFLIFILGQEVKFFLGPTLHWGCIPSVPVEIWWGPKCYKSLSSCALLQGPEISPSTLQR